MEPMYIDEGLGSSPRVRGKLFLSALTCDRSRLIPARAGKTLSAPRSWRMVPAHPRACGENASALGAPATDFGSSPRVRGKPVGGVHGNGLGGLIPACAGKTPPNTQSHSSGPAHPRVCGENETLQHGDTRVSGSSPRVRGKPGLRAPRALRGGLIPACAGKTRARPQSRDGGTAHPRVCGENSGRLAVRRVLGGSSPRVRGKPTKDLITTQRLRLIPACAGKTARWPWYRRPPAAHPRVCGENKVNPFTQPTTEGSSPRVRGKRSGVSQAQVSRGLIPACAGKTPSCPPGSGMSAAHPRVCGENPAPEKNPRIRSGSSPRVRGKRAYGAWRLRLCRLIPACAGKTSPPTHRRAASSAHPRMCGENSRTVDHDGDPDGSSPRVRGKRRRGRRQGHRRRLIPACAGKTPSRGPRRCGRGAHPRVCGENPAGPPTRDSAPGSSPRVRGKPPQLRRAPPSRGLIPACAGKTLTEARASFVTWAHPRVCGENRRDRRPQGVPAGSSPRVRGKPMWTTLIPRLQGLIPACAGKTSAGHAQQGGLRAHPRVCGENQVQVWKARLESGSSPRVRGKRGQGLRRAGHPRLIPACAGKTPRSTTTSCPAAAHPRVCGENSATWRSAIRCIGSSPRVRGKHAEQLDRLLVVRLIPACAGKT